jgi:hypothetical protein
VWFSRAPTPKTMHGPSPAPTITWFVSEAGLETKPAVERARLAAIQDEPTRAGGQESVLGPLQWRLGTIAGS